MAENVDLTLLAKLARDNLAETRAMRHELTDVRTLALQTTEYLRRVEQRLDGRLNDVDARMSAIDARIGGVDSRIASLRDDLELMILGGFR